MVTQRSLLVVSVFVMSFARIALAQGKKFRVDSTTGKIQYANQDGCNVQTILEKVIVKPQGLVLDLAGQKTYRADSDNNG